MNPCTLGWYLPLLVSDNDTPGAFLQPSEFSTPIERCGQREDEDSRGGKYNNNNGEHWNDDKHGHGHGRGIDTAHDGIVAGELTAQQRASGSTSGVASSQFPLQMHDKNNINNKSERQGGSTNTGSSRWEALDAEFRKGLPNSAYVGRLAYRGMAMRACPDLRVLDGVRVAEKERRKAEALLERVLAGDAKSNEATVDDEGRS